MKKLPLLTIRECDRLMRRFHRSPLTSYTFYRDPEAKGPDDASTLRTVILRRKGKFQVWLDVSDGKTEFIGSFGKIWEAREAEAKAVRCFVESITTSLADQLDAIWDYRPFFPVKWKYPMLFTDTTDFVDGCELRSGRELLDFFAERRACIFEAKVPGSPYLWWLRDANGVRCYPVRSHRGQILLEGSDREHPCYRS